MSKLFVDSLYNDILAFQILLVGTQLIATFVPLHVHDTFANSIALAQELDVCVVDVVDDILAHSFHSQ